jgi:CrcB protein
VGVARVNDESPRRVDAEIQAGRNQPERPRPAHLSVGNILLVGVGGAVGSALRAEVAVLVPPWLGVQLGIFGVNLAGAFLLGLLLELLAEHGPDVGWSRRLRLIVGTGVLGGFTTYSALASGTAALAAVRPGLAAGYGLATVLAGGLASVVGIAVSRHGLRPTLTAGGRRR